MDTNTQTATEYSKTLMVNHMDNATFFMENFFFMLNIFYVLKKAIILKLIVRKKIDFEIYHTNTNQICIIGTLKSIIQSMFV